MNFNLPQNITTVLNRITEHGHSAYIVGGCVRDLLCGKAPHDYDITTSALPEQIENIFENTVKTGIKHGTVTVIIDGEPIEVTTFRTDGNYSDSRRPDSVKYVSDVKFDLSRRDFTVNAMCYNEKEGLIDCFDGAQDIKCGILRAVGEPEARFREDALRILRLFRFASTLGFEIEKSTLTAAIKCAHLLQNISAERILSELKRAACGDNTAVLASLFESGGLSEYYIGKGCTESVSKLKPKQMLRLFALLNLTSFDFEKSLLTLRCSNDFKNYANKMHDLCKSHIKADKAEIKKILISCEKEILYDFLEYIRVISGTDTSQIEYTLDYIISSNEPYLISHLDISGKDIEALGFNGREIGDKLEYLLESVIDEPRLNKKENLIKLISN